MSSPLQSVQPTPASTEATGPRERAVTSIEGAHRAISEIIAYVRMLARRIGNVALANPVMGAMHGEKAGDLDARFIHVLSPAVPDEEFEVAHFLGRPPVGYEVVALYGKPAIFYAPGTLGANGWSDVTIRLKCNTKNASALLRVF